MVSHFVPYSLGVMDIFRHQGNTGGYFFSVQVGELTSQAFHSAELMWEPILMVIEHTHALDLTEWQLIVKNIQEKRQL